MIIDKSRTLLISRVGSSSLHSHWLAPQGDRNFDLLLSAYDERVKKPEMDGLVFEYRPGSKVAGYAALLRDHRALWQGYDYVALFDDDLLIDARGLNRLFELVQQHDLKLAQPALTRDSYFTYAALLAHPGFTLRYMSFIEMMCPVFRIDALEAVLPIFDMGFESGIDIIWSNMLGTAPHDMAVIDAVTVAHHKRIGKDKAANGFAGDRRYEDDIAAIMRHFDSPWLPCLPFEGVRRDGRRVTQQSAFLPDALTLAAAIPAQSPMKRRARNIAVYWKHLLSARARTQPLAWPVVPGSEAQNALGRDAAAQEVEQA